MTTSPVRCDECGGLLGPMSCVENDNWTCEFCGAEKAVALDPGQKPAREVFEYVLNMPSGPKQEGEMKGVKRNVADESLVIFCLDNSGSMGENVKFDGQVKLPPTIHSGKLEYLNRMQCIQAAVHYQLEAMAEKFPNQQPVLIVFSSTLVIYYGKDKEVRVASSLHDFDALHKQGAALANDFAKTTMSVGSVAPDLIKRVDKLQPDASTALGPAVAVALGMSANARGSKIIICTDGLANCGYGELNRSTVKQEYAKMGQVAKEQGCQVSVLSIRGTDCKMEMLGVLAEATQGTVDVVNPLEIEKQFASLVSQVILGTGISCTVRLDDRFAFTQNTRSSCVSEIGAVTPDTDIVFQFEPKRFFDAEGMKIPVQVEINYCRPDGAQCLRVMCRTLELTHDRDKAEAHLDAPVVALSAVHHAAEIGQEGDYQHARVLLISTQRLLQRGMKGRQAQKTYINFVKQGERLDGFMRIAQHQAKVLGSDMSKKDDTMARNIIQMKSCSIALLQQ